MKLNEALTELAEFIHSIKGYEEFETHDRSLFDAAVSAFNNISDALRWRKLEEERPTEVGFYLVKLTSKQYVNVDGCRVYLWDEKYGGFCVDCAGIVTHWLPIHGPEVGE